MRKLLLTTLTLAVAGHLAFAQDSPIKFGVKAGVNLPTVSLTGDDVDSDEKDALKSSLSFYVGATADFSISPIFSIQPGLTLSGKGYKMSDEFEGASFETTNNVMYLEIPVNAVARFAAGSGNVFVGAGPYYGFALSGKTKWEASFDGETESDEEDVEFGNGDGETKRGDFGVNLLAGYELSNGFNIHLGYGLGLGNLSNETDVKVNNRVFSVGVGFSF
ncbi:MAG TPA: porin family protein [Parapedobacter sp.]|uniref:porin family protein n=1 Tax=Parapedobacter sp. TaxID=1958893 RepID=UPI002CE92C1B|nr:porin family protein [Parapedobacter sp.]HWK59293.1 porin family protein [Parapedobacter sp.]